MIGGWVDPAVVFMIGTCLALVINYPNVAEQRAAHRRARQGRVADGLHPARGRRVHRHHDRASGMLKAMAQDAVALRAGRRRRSTCRSCLA